MGKRQAGEGSAHRRKDGRWQASRSIGPRGQAKRFYGYGPTRREAFAALARKVDNHERRADLDAAGTWTVADFLDWWTGEELPAREADGTLSQSSVTAYAGVARELRERLGAQRLSTLGPQHVRRMLADAGTEGVPDTRRHRLHAILSIALGAAERYEFIDRNPVAKVPAPRKPSRPRPQVVLDDARRFLSAAEDDRLWAYWRLMLSVPLRPGEPAGLAWDDDDLNLEEGTYVVRRNLVRVKTAPGEGEWRRHETKGRKQRTVPLPSVTVVALRQHRARMLEERLSRGWQAAPVVDPDGLRSVWPVFASVNGRWIWPHMIRRDLARICDRAGIGVWAPHDLRRACITMMTAAGIHPSVIVQAAGHATLSQSDVYIGALDAALKEAIDGLADSLSG